MHVVQRCLVSAEIRSSDAAPIAGSSASSVHLLDDREFPSLTVGPQGGIKSAPRRSLDIDVSPLAPVLEAELLRADSIEARILDEAGAVHWSRLASAAFYALLQIAGMSDAGLHRHRALLLCLANHRIRSSHGSYPNALQEAS